MHIIIRSKFRDFVTQSSFHMKNMRIPPGVIFKNNRYEYNGPVRNWVSPQLYVVASKENCTWQKSVRFQISVGISQTQIFIRTDSVWNVI